MNESDMSSGIHDRDEVSPLSGTVGSLLHYMHLLLLLSCYGHFKKEVHLKCVSRGYHRVTAYTLANHSNLPVLERGKI